MSKPLAKRILDETRDVAYGAVSRATSVATLAALRTLRGLVVDGAYRATSNALSVTALNVVASVQERLNKCE